MAVRKRRSKIFLVLLSVVLLLALLVAALPLWFPWVLRPIAKRYGAAYASYQRVGYQRFQLSDLTFTNGATHLQAQEVTGIIPSLWLWRHLTDRRDQQFVDVRSWKYTSVPSQTSHSNTTASVHHVFRTIQGVANGLRDWIPAARLADGSLLIQNQSIGIPQAVWTNGNLTATVALSNQPPVTVTAATAPSAPWKLRVDSEANQLRSEFLITDGANNLDIAGKVDWMTNHIDISASFPPQGFIPDTAGVRADSFDVHAPLLRSWEATDLRGALHADWRTNHFELELTAKAIQDGTNLPPVDIEIRASGDTNTAHIDVARISTPALHLELPAPVAMSFRPPFLFAPADLNVAIDLDRQHRMVAHGKLNGRAVFYRDEKAPRVTFTLSGTGIATTSVTTSNLDLQGELNWPVLDVQRAHIVMDDSSRVDISGKYDFAQKMIHDGTLNSSGAFGGQFLPADYSFETASISAKFDGAFSSVTNSVKAQVKNFTAPHINPVNVDVSWNAEGLNAKSAEVTLKSESSSLMLRGATDFGSKRKNVALSALELSNSNGVALRLEQPAQVALEQNTNTGTNHVWSITIDPLHLTGEGRDFSLAANVHWPERGAIQCEAHGLDARLLSGFIHQADTDALLSHLAFTGGWTNGPITFQLDSEATLKTREQFPFTAVAKITGGKAGVAIEQFSVLSATQIVCRAEGALPVSFDPAKKGDILQIDDNAPLKLHVLTDPKSVLWKKIAAATGLRLDSPNLTANLEGTWAAPQGQVTLQVRRIELSGLERPLPSVENVDLLAVMDRATARVSKFHFEVEKQPVDIKGEIPLGESFWTGLPHKQHLPDWHEATAHLQIDQAQLAAFTPLLPQILSAEGSASADISLERGGNLRGTLSVTNARTHPLESIGPIRNIQVLAQLDGHTLRLEHTSGEVGGQRVNVDGTVQLDEEIWRTNGLPLFQVHVSGTNVPLARNPSVLLRANVDLTATNSGTQIPVVYGSVKLRDSLFLADLQALVPERTASARRRPPYFSVEAEPWAQWKLKVNVTGDGFLRVQTPLFHGKVSTVLSLQGTLKDPLVLGQVKIDPGSAVTFPFSSLDVKQGFISLTSEDPYRPQLFVTAGSRRFGYDVKMEATGPVDQPVVQFSSIPGLSSEEIVLMLTAGQVPRGIGAPAATTQQRAQGLALFVGKNLLSDFGLGGSGEERLTFRSGEEITETGRPTYDIEYKLNDRWSLIGEYDRFDQYNLNVKYKIYSK
ncbi:MAG TPA: translocation/assembly module TamB domain-containing protein [Verrucomicrobiae bacterium]|nr:translocation/assembly module TamB domain-containing protein [Verrucomicrobiae bacterium]